MLPFSSYENKVSADTKEVAGEGGKKIVMYMLIVYY
jgi:hypothetical protein